MVEHGGHCRLLLAWALLGGLQAEASADSSNGPCEQQLRYRHSSTEMGGPWVSTIALLSSICAIWLFVIYALRCLCTKKNQCARKLAKEPAMTWEVQDPCPEELHLPPSCQTPALPSSPPQYSSVSGLAHEAYTHQLACMEHELERFLAEVRHRQGTGGVKAGEERTPLSSKWGSEKLRITVYEIADCEQPGRTWAQGRKRKVK